MGARRKDRSRNTPRPRLLPSRAGSASVRWANAKFDLLASSLSVDEFIQFDRYAIWFYVLCAAVFGIASLANLNGSSSGFYRNYGYAPQKAPCAGSSARNPFR